jgi:hypothetical protein
MNRDLHEVAAKGRKKLKSKTWELWVQQLVECFDILAKWGVSEWH